MRKTPILLLGIMFIIGICNVIHPVTGFHQQIGVKVGDSYYWKVKQSFDEQQTWSKQYYIAHYITEIRNNQDNQTLISGQFCSSSYDGFWESVQEEQQLASIGSNPSIVQILTSSYLANMSQPFKYHDILDQEVKDLFSHESNVTTWKNYPYQIEINLKYENRTETRIWIRFNHNGVKKHQITEIKTPTTDGDYLTEYIDIFTYSPKNIVKLNDLFPNDENQERILHFTEKISILEWLFMILIILLIILFRILIKEDIIKFISFIRHSNPRYRNKEVVKAKTSSKRMLKAWFFTFLLLGTFESSLILLDASDNLLEPYEWGIRNEIALKFNECSKIFDENEDKLKIVILGDSRAQTGIDAMAIDRFFNHTTISFNLAINATEIIFESLYIMDLIIPKLQPDLIIWDFSPSDFISFEGSDQRVNETVRNSIGKVYWEDWNNQSEIPTNDAVHSMLMKYSLIYRYKTNFVPKFFNSSYIQDEELHHEIIKVQGSNYLYSKTPKLSGSIQRVENTYFDTNRRDIFLEALETIQNNKIPLFFSFQPYYYKTINNTVFDEMLKEFKCPSKEYQIDSRWNYTYIDDNQIFSDRNHFNLNGMTLYTQEVIDKIKNTVNSIQGRMQIEFAAKNMFYRY